MNKLVQVSPTEAVRSKAVLMVMVDNDLKVWVATAGMTKSLSSHSFEETVKMFPNLVPLSNTHAVAKSAVACVGISANTLKVVVVLITSQTVVSSFGLAETVALLNEGEE